MLPNDNSKKEKSMLPNEIRTTTNL